MQTTEIVEQQSAGRSMLSGAVAGAVASLAFAWIHDIFISDIWFSLVMMIPAGILCGACIGWSYARLVEEPSTGSWWRYNMLYVGLLALLGLLSVLVFEPVTTMAALSELDGPPDQLIGQALPLTAVFTLLAAVMITRVYRQNWGRFPVVLLTCFFLILLLGLNVSVLGLVYIPRGSLYLVTEFFALILAINLVYAAVFTALERRHW